MLLNIVEVIGGLVLLIWGADRFVHGAAAAARNLGVAPLLIGLTIVAFATSAPEILVSVVAAEPLTKLPLAIGGSLVAAVQWILAFSQQQKKRPVGRFLVPTASPGRQCACPGKLS